MKLLVDFFPIILFFVAFKFFGIYIATTVAMSTCFIQVGWQWFKHHKVDMLQIVTLVLITVLGTATLLLHNELFIKWKPTAINWIFAAIFLGSHLTKQTIMQRLMSNNISLPTNVWTRLNLSWVIFFFITGLVNIYVVYHFDTNTWVNFKLFGVLGMTVAFVVLQAIYLSRYIKPEVK
jgi:intracellular septation protein